MPLTRPARAAKKVLIQYILSKTLSLSFSIPLVDLDLSGLELEVLGGKLDTLLRNYYINNVYSFGAGVYVFRFHHSEWGDRLLVVDEGLGFWLSEGRPAEGQRSEFLTKLRREIIRARLERVKTIKGERLAILEMRKDDHPITLVLEFFGGGNVIVLDREGRIRLAEKEAEFRHRVIRRGAEYRPPPSRGLPLSEEVSLDFEDGDLEVVRYIGRKVAIGRKFAEEVVKRAGIERMKRVKELNEEEKCRLNDAIRLLAKEVVSAKGVYSYYKEGELKEVSFARLTHLEGLEERYSEGLIESLDRLLTPLAYRKLVELKAAELRRRLEELEKGVQHQRERLKRMKAQSRLLREIALALPSAQDYESLLLQRVEEVDPKGKVEAGVLFLLGERIRLEGPWKVATKLFGLAKEVERGVRELEGAIGKLEKERDKLAKKVEEVRVETKRVRKRKWYEKFRWFYTSDGHLAIGGRDASTNSQLIRKYMGPADLVFHAEISGSPFFLLKKGQEAGELAIKEAATATVSFSRAWRAGLVVADAYYVRPDQVSASAPSGEYLPKGSFMIFGKRNYLRGLELRLGVGVVYEDGVPVVVSGPVNSVRSRCEAYVEIEPGHLQQSEVAKRIRAILSKELGKELPPLEDFQRALPPGGSRIVGLRKTIKRDHN